MRGDKENYPHPIISVILIVLLILATVNLALASGDEIEQELENTIAIGGNNSLGLGFGGAQFDVDIGQCIGSEAQTWFFGIYGRQTLKENAWCHAITLINSGYTDAGEWLLCHYTYLSEMPDCPGPMFIQPETNSIVDDASVVEDTEDEFVQEQLMQYQMQITDLASSLDNLKSNQARSARQASVQKQADQEYAQEVLKKLEAYQQ